MVIEFSVMAEHGSRGPSQRAPVFLFAVQGVAKALVLLAIRVGHVCPGSAVILEQKHTGRAQVESARQPDERIPSCGILPGEASRAQDSRAADDAPFERDVVAEYLGWHSQNSHKRQIKQQFECI